MTNSKSQIANFAIGYSLSMGRLNAADSPDRSNQAVVAWTITDPILCYLLSAILLFVITT